MRTTVKIDAKLLAAAQVVLCTNDKTRAVELALQTVVTQAARRRLAALRGTMPTVRAGRRRRPKRSAKRST